MSSPADRVRLEHLREEHITAILAIEKVVNTAPWSEKSFRNELDNPHSVFRVALLDSRVIGYGGCWLMVDEAHITTVAVDEEHRRLGIGRRMVVELLNVAKERGMVCATLEVRASNEAAIQLYEKLGFKGTATRKGYYPENSEDALVMWLYELDQWDST